MYSMLDIPSVQPNSPGFLTIIREGAVRTLERPEEKRVVGMTLPLHGNVAGPITGERPRYIWEGIRHSEIYSAEFARKRCVKITSDPQSCHSGP